MPHRRSLRNRQLRDARKLILDSSFHDRDMAESINILTNFQVVEDLQRKYPYVHVDVLSFVRGEVVIDSRGRGSFQK